MSSTIDKRPAEYYRGERYKEYLLTQHWQTINSKFIHKNPKAQCWICETPVLLFERDGRITSNLLIHHESYQFLFHERLGRDIVILCFNCHNQVHFYKILVFISIKTKLIRKALVKRRYFLRFRYLVRNRRIWLALWCLFRYSVIV